eukprot:TRINITY_DN72672_c0_g1_i1.p1 TRINITY_DN72672_c0_g1~~TRINITY_DN72672_c0_g1_i1.p1  ORF type:complete len:310 (-),score=31.44 TRINITY_DN72672_c0_g1_i1:45-974(-)
MLELPPLPRVDGSLFQTLRGPTDCSNWVIPGKLLVGQYPGAFEDSKNNQLLRRYLSRGVDTFVSLQAELDPDVPEEIWREGTTLRPYFQDAQRLTRKQLKWMHLPIEDGDVAPDDVMCALVRALSDDIAEGRILYVHGWGGHGRTGVLACLLLAYLYRIQASDVLKRIQACHDCRLDPRGVKSPQTVAQRDQVKRLVRVLLNGPAPAVEVMRDSEPVLRDRFGNKRMGKSSQTASCPALGNAREAAEKQKQLCEERAMPSHLLLPAMPGASARTRREASLRLKSLAAAQKRKTPFASQMCSAVEPPLIF